MVRVLTGRNRFKGKRNVSSFSGLSLKRLVFSWLQRVRGGRRRWGGPERPRHSPGRSSSSRFSRRTYARRSRSVRAASGGDTVEPSPRQRDVKEDAQVVLRRRMRRLIRRHGVAAAAAIALSACASHPAPPAPSPAAAPADLSTPAADSPSDGRLAPGDRPPSAAVIGRPQAPRRRQLAALQACYAAAVKENPGLAGGIGGRESIRFSGRHGDHDSRKGWWGSRCSTPASRSPCQRCHFPSRRKNTAWSSTTSSRHHKRIEERPSVRGIGLEPPGGLAPNHSPLNGSPRPRTSSANSGTNG